MEECLVPAHRNQHFQWLGATTEMPKMRKVELRGCREMDEPIGGILRGAGIAAGESGGCPLLLPAHMIDDGVAGHGRDTSRNRSGVKGRDAFAARRYRKTHATIRYGVRPHRNFLVTAQVALSMTDQLQAEIEKRSRYWPKYAR